MFSLFRSKVTKKVVDVNINTQNATWLINEELKRMHALVNKCLDGKAGNNIQVFWDRLSDLQKKSLELADKSQDPDLVKAVADIQNTLIDQTLLEEKNE